MGSNYAFNQKSETRFPASLSSVGSEDFIRLQKKRKKKVEFSGQNYDSNRNVKDSMTFA